MTEPKLHFNVGGPRGWTTACGIESASFDEKWDDVDCKRCLRSRPAAPVIPTLDEVLNAEIVK